MRARASAPSLAAQLLAALLLAALVAGCDPSELRDRVTGGTPHERYARSLADAGLDGTALGRDWLVAAERALAAPMPVAIPFREAGYFASSTAGAVAYQLRPLRGQLLRVTVATRSNDPAVEPSNDAAYDAADDASGDTTAGDTTAGDGAGRGATDGSTPEPPARLFVDLYEIPDDSTREARHIADGDSATVILETTAGRDVSYLVRLQPELLREIRYEITVEVAPSLGFPVSGRDSRAVRSFWGAARDGGARSHEGIDIFAGRGTPAIASANGVIRDVGLTRLGGKVVWLSDTAGRQSLYYAHLDSQLVQPGDNVLVGDTLGLVGNTGNARTTAPHLHFGIYRRGEGAVDPLPFVATARGRPAALTADTAWLGQEARTTSARLSLRRAPSRDAPAALTLPRSTMLVVDGASGGWLRVRLPDATAGYLAASAVEPTTQPVRGERVVASAPIRSRPTVASFVVDSIGGDAATVPVTGRYGDWLLVEPPGRRRGWIDGRAAGSDGSR